MKKSLGDKLGIASFVLGIVSVIMAIIVSEVGLIAAIVSFAMNILAKDKGCKLDIRFYAIGLSVIGFLVSVILLVLYAVILNMN